MKVYREQGFVNRSYIYEYGVGTYRVGAHVSIGFTLTMLSVVF
jgi:hypothetical protein